MNILEEAQKIVSERRDNYGGPAINFQRIAAMWKVILQQPVTQTEVALMMIAVKMCREIHSHQRDNWVDIAGYAECGDLVSQPYHPSCCCPGTMSADKEHKCTICGQAWVRNVGGKWVVAFVEALKDDKKACQHPLEKVNTTGPRAYCHHCQRYVLQDKTGAPKWITDAIQES